MNERYDCIKLDNQLCFPLYAVSKEVIRKYKKHLDPLDLTYTQYLVMMAIWEKGDINTKALGKLIKLDSGTLTPVLKKLENKGYITRTRDAKDERNLLVSITKLGIELKEEAILIPPKIFLELNLTFEEAKTLENILKKIIV